MSVNTPPNPNVNTFNNLYWIDADTALTYAEASKKFLKFPIAQGAEALQATTVNGDFTLNNTKIHLGTGSGASQAGGCIAIGNGAGSTSQTGASAIAIGVSAGTTSQATLAIAIGASSGQLSQAQLSVAIGNAAGQNNLPDSAIAIGSSAAVGSAGVAGCGQRSICIGRLAKGGVGGNDSVAIGNQADTSTFTSSVALGINALCSANNQIRLGTATENVSILGTITSTGLITATGGLTIGGANNITLGSGATAPTAGQLGYNEKTNISSTPTINSSIASGQIATFTIVNVGTYIITCNFVINNPINTASNAYTNAFFGLNANSFTNGITGSSIFITSPVSTLSTGYTTGSFSFIYSTTSTSIPIYLNAVGSFYSGTLPIVNANTYITYIRIA